MSSYKDSEEYKFRRSTKAKFTERHLEKCLMMPDAPAQETSRSGDTPRYWNMWRVIFVGVIIRLLTKHSEFFFKLLSIPLLIILGGAIISVIPSAEPSPTGSASVGHT